MGSEQREQGRFQGRRIVAGAFVLLVVLGYVAVILLYSANARSGQGGTLGTSDAEAVRVEMAPVSVNGPGERLSVDVRIFPPDSLVADDNLTLTKDLSVIISPIDGTQAVSLEAGSLALVTKTISVPAAGTVENWPFDRYDATLSVLAYSTEDGVKTALPTFVQWQGSVSGWNFQVQENHEKPVAVTDTDGRTESLPSLDIGASRSGSTLAFGFLLLSLLVVMPVLVLFVAIRAYTGHRKVEATLTSWMGAMLFATIPLRGFLPGSPPIGSWIDFLVVLWVIVGLIAGLTIYVLAWNRWGTPDPQFARGAPPSTPPHVNGGAHAD